jgi:hypothetical protein
MAAVSMTNSKASTYFKFKASLSLSLSLLAAFFLSFFLIGCGGGGGGGSQASLPSIESGFPAFNVAFTKSEKSIAYDHMSKADFDEYNKYLENKGFDCDDGECSKSSPISGIYEAYTVGGSSDDLNINVSGYAVEINLVKSGGSEIDSALFAQVFPQVNGKESLKTATKYGISSSSFDAYADALEDDEFTYKNGVYYKKKDGLIYACNYDSYDNSVMWIIARDYFEDDLI